MARLRRMLVVAGIVLAVGLVVVMTVTADPFLPDSYGPGQDARAYWAVPIGAPYAPGSVGHESAYLYSPAFLELLTPIRVLPWPAFLGIWTTGLLLVLRWLSGPFLFAPLIVLTFPELWGGNITILLAAMIVIGFRRPGVWAFAVLTKVTPALGMLWFAVRQEWRALVEVTVVTGVVVLASLAVALDLWRHWIELLATSVDSSTVSGSVPIPLLVRVPFAVLVIAWAARGDRRWALPIGVLLAMPVIWWGSFAILTASVALTRPAIERRLFGGVEGLGDPARSVSPAS